MEYGWPQHKREEVLSKLNVSQQPQYHAQINFMNQKMNLPVYRIPIGLPKYRLENGRTISLQYEWIANKKDARKDLFKYDPENNEAQKAQHAILMKLMGDSSLYPFFKDSDHKQNEFLILDYLGFVVNGNRRLCTWRVLIESDPVEYKHFEYVDVIVLPQSDPKAIQTLEAELQLEKNIKAEYVWHTKANMFYERLQDSDMDIKMLAHIYKTKESEIKLLLDKRDYAVAYLETRHWQNNWSKLDDKDYAFEQMIKFRKKLRDTDSKLLFDKSCYALMDDSSGGRTYQLIADLYKHFEAVKKAIKEKAVAKMPENERELPPDSTDDIDIIAGTGSNAEVIEVAKDMDKEENREEYTEAIKETLESETSKKKGEEKASYVKIQLDNANGSIQNALAGIVKKDASKVGIAEVITSIEHALVSIKKWLE